MYPAMTFVRGSTRFVCLLDQLGTDNVSTAIVIWPLPLVVN